MKPDLVKTPEFANFDRLVSQVLSVSKADVQRRDAEEEQAALAKRNLEEKHGDRRA